MKTLCLLLLAAVWVKGAASLRGRVTDPSGAAVPGAVVELKGGAQARRTMTDGSGEYTFPAIEAGKYQVRISARGFAAAERSGVTIARPTVIDTQLSLQAGRDVIVVSGETRGVSTSPAANGGAVLLGRRQIAELSDDPDELALQLQALAGPAPGPDGGQLYIDGFNGNNLPPKSSIREIRINSNPFSPEYDRPGFARIDVYTKPGTEDVHGQGFAQYNDQRLDARNPLLAQPAPPYRAQLYGLEVGGPLRRNRASFTLAVEGRQIGENALILATTPSGTINQAVHAPQTRFSISPRIDIALNTRNTLTARYQELDLELDNQGVGDFSLPSRAYNQRQTERVVQITETAALSPRAVDETRFQYLRPLSKANGAQPSSAVDVLGAFSSGGSPAGNSGSTVNNWELTNLLTQARGKHALKFGGRARQSILDDTSFVNFQGTFTFYTLDQYLAGTPAVFSLSAGSPQTRVKQFDIGLFAGDDWSIRPNLTVSAGLRYEAQTAVGDLADWAPRIGAAWGFHKTVLRAGAGIFYDRIPVNTMLNALRFNGLTQQAFVILDPTFYPSIPPLAVLEAESQPQQLRPLYAGIRAPQLYQASASLERQLIAGSKITFSWVESRGVHLPNTRNINTPIAGAYPFGDASIRLLSEDVGLSRQRQFIANLNVNRKRAGLFGYYALSYAKDNNEGLPADPYNLRAEWGPATWGDVRHRAVFGSNLNLPGRITASPFVAANSGAPYNIITGLDPGDTGFATARPAWIGAPGCKGAACFNADPPPGTAIVSRNFGRGPGAVTLAMRISRTWAFGGEGRSGTPDTSSSGHGPGPGMVHDAPTGRRYNVTVSASTMNALNHTNLGPPDGDLASPYFGQSRSLGGLIVMAHGGGASTYNRKIDLQVRLTF